MSISLRITHADGGVRDIFLAFGSYVISRDAGDIALNDPLASAAHARLDAHPRGVTVTDLGSRNGTFDPQGRPMTGPVSLQLDESVRIGSSYVTLTAFLAPAGGTVLGPASPSSPQAAMLAVPTIGGLPPGGAVSPPTPPSGGSSRTRSRTGPVGLVIALAVSAVLITVGAAAYLLSSGTRSKLSRSVPKDVHVFIEVPSIPRAIESFAAMGILDSEKLKGSDVGERMRKQVERTFDLEKADAAALMSSVESMAFAVRRSTSRPETVMLLAFSERAGVEALLKSDRFDKDGNLGGGTQYSVERERVDMAELNALPRHRRALALLEFGEIGALSANDVLVWYADAKILAFGSKELVEDVGGVLVDGDEALADSGEWKEVEFADGSSVFAFVDSDLFGDIEGASLEPLARGYFQDIAPLTASVQFVDTGTLVSIDAELKGKATRSESATTTPATLDLYEKLPMETVAYIAISTNREESAEDFEKRASAQVESLGPLAARQLQGTIEQMQQDLGVTFEDLLEVLGDQAVLAVAREGDIGSGATEATQWDERGGIALLLRVADEERAEAVAAKLQKNAVRGTIVHLEDEYLLVAAGGLRDRFIESLRQGKDTLAEDDAHQAALETMEGRPNLVVWVDSSRLRGVLLDMPGVRRDVAVLEDELGFDIDAVRHTGDHRVTSRLSLRVEPKDEHWGVRLQLLNFGPGVMALGSLIESVDAAPRLSLASIIGGGSDVDRAVTQMEAFAEEMCACGDAGCAARVSAEMQRYGEEMAKKYEDRGEPEVSTKQKLAMESATSRLMGCTDAAVTGRGPFSDKRDSKRR